MYFFLSFSLLLELMLSAQTKKRLIAQHSNNRKRKEKEIQLISRVAPFFSFAATMRLKCLVAEEKKEK
jgi:hypothetical protein